MASTSVVFDILANDRASSKFAAVGKAADKSTTPMAKMGKIAKTAAIGVAAVGAGAIAAGKYVFDYGAKLEQMGMKAETVFGNQLGSVQKWADKSAAAMGLTSREATGLAANFADLLIPMGFTRKQAAGMATDVVGLSGALSQWSGGTKSAAEVTEILNAAMLGETDGLKALGISISAAEIDARLLKNGQDKLTGSALQQAEALATQALIMEKSTDAQKAFADGGSPLLTAQAKIKSTLGEVRDELIMGLVPALSTGAEYVADHLVPAIEGGIDAAREIGRALAPAAEEIVEALGHLAGEGDGIGDMFHNTFIPAVRTTAEVVGTLVDFVDDLPGPVKSLGVEVGIAALVFPRLAAGIVASKDALTGYASRVQGATVKTVLMSDAMRTAAGIGGAVALTKSVNETNDAIGFLEKTAGGAAVGFSVGGPWGAALGTAAGAVWGLQEPLKGLFQKILPETYHAVEYTARTFAVSKTDVGDFASSLDQLTGALTESTRAMALQALQQAKVLGTGRELGLTTREMIDAALGVPRASRKVTSAIYDQWQQAGILDNKYLHLSDTLNLTTRDLNKAQRETRQTSRATQELAGKLKGIPPKVRTKVLAEGIPVGLKNLAALSKRYHLLPKQINTLIEAAELPFTVKQVKNFQGEIDKTDKKKATPKFDADDKRFRENVNRTNQSLNELDRRKATPKADLSLEQYFQDRANLITSLNNIPDETVYIDVYERFHPDPDRPGGNNRAAPSLTTTPPGPRGPGFTMTTPRAMSASPMSSSGGVTVNINGPVFGDPQAFAREVQKQLLALKRNSGVTLGLS